MFYLLIQIKFFADESQDPTKNIYSYSSKQAAIQKYHEKMAALMSDNTLNKGNIIIVDANGMIVVSDTWTREN